MIREAVTAWPLYWPEGWKRTASPRPARFGATTVYRESQRLLEELGRLGVRRDGAIISTNLKLKRDGTPYSGQRQPEDRGVSVWFDLRGEERVLACDRWTTVEDNLRAIVCHIGALRGQERWGVGSADQAFAGFVALPERAGGKCWWQVLRVSPDASPETIESAYRVLAKERHPDHGGSRELWDELADAIRAAREAME